MSTFFDSVAKHNLERFHSECLCWYFNLPENKVQTEFFISQISNIKEIQFVEAHTEVDDIDIVLHFKDRFDNNCAVLIENKIKANESFKENKKNQSEEEAEKYSQTERYYQRSNDNDNEIKKRIFQKKQRNIEMKIKYFYVFLVANRIKTQDSQELVNGYNYEQLNAWSLCDPNPWKTFSYSELVKILNESAKQTGDQKNLDVKEEIVADQENLEIKIGKYYLEYLTNEFKDDINTHDYGANKFGKYEYFKLLVALIKRNLACDVYKETRKTLAIDAKSSNGKDPLFNINLTSEFKIPNLDHSWVMGIQLQGEVFKIFIAAKDYENVRLEEEDKNTYRIWCEETLLDIISEFKKSRSVDIAFKPNENKSKTFFSFSFNFSKGREINFLGLHGSDIKSRANILSDLIKEISTIVKSGEKLKRYSLIG